MPAALGSSYLSQVYATVPWYPGGYFASKQTASQVFMSSNSGLTFSPVNFAGIGTAGIQDPKIPTFASLAGTYDNHCAMCSPTKYVSRISFGTPNAGWAVCIDGAIYKY